MLSGKLADAAMAVHGARKNDGRQRTEPLIIVRIGSRYGMEISESGLQIVEADNDSRCRETKSVD